MALALSTFPPQARDRAVAAAGEAYRIDTTRIAMVTEAAMVRAREDAELLERIARQDRAAFATLYDRLSPPLYATALKILRDPAEAQDVVHDSFISVWDKAGTFEARRGSAFAWIVTLVRNRAIDRVRARRRRSELLAESVPADLGYTEVAPTAAGHESAVANEDAQAVRAAIDTLPPDQRRALELAFFGGLTQEQISQSLREPLGTIKARIRRGLIKLRENLIHRP
jgi:RNA polymerase sigma-70 factor (ECF subfamily)